MLRADVRNAAAADRITDQLLAIPTLGLALVSVRSSMVEIAHGVRPVVTVHWICPRVVCHWKGR